MMWVALGVTAVLLGLVALAIRYARSDARRSSDAEASGRTVKALTILGKPDDTAESLDELRRRYAARQRRRRLRSEEGGDHPPDAA